MKGDCDSEHERDCGSSGDLMLEQFDDEVKTTFEFCVDIGCMTLKYCDVCC